jgi:hypothetical protein
MSKYIDDYIKRLQRRKEYLEKSAGNPFAQAELAALKWVIVYLEDNKEHAATHQHEYFEKIKKENNETNKIHSSSNDPNDSVREPSA